MVPISVGVRRVSGGCLDGVWMVLGWSCLLEAFRLLFYVRKWRKMGMELQMLLQIGITKYGNRNYRFGVFGGMIEGEGKG